MNQTELDDLIFKLFNVKKSIKDIKIYLHVSQERIEIVNQSKNSNANLIHQKGCSKSKNFLMVNLKWIIILIMIQVHQHFGSKKKLSQNYKLGYLQQK